MTKKEEKERREDDRLITILPSYQMFRSIVSKPLIATNEDLRSEPPSYDVTPISSAASGDVDYFGGVSMANSPVQEINEPFTSWDDTILANSHKLKRLTSTNRDLASKLEVKIHLTDELGMIGVPATIIDPLSVEYEQGDVINGFVTIVNRTTTTIPFDMFAVALEGATILGDSKRPVVQNPKLVQRFLTMLDFNASYNDGTLDRLVSDNNNPHVHVARLDPVDNTQVFLDIRKVFEPGITYKKFFTFKIPDRLLDYSCKPHGLVKHLQLPPTFGVSKNEVLTRLREKWRDHADFKPEDVDHRSKHPDRKYASQTNDFCLEDTSVSYCVTAKIIGRAEEYKEFTRYPVADAGKLANEYVVANEANCYLRVIGRTDPAFELNRSMINQESKLLYENLMTKIEAILDKAQQLSQAPKSDQSTEDEGLVPSVSVEESQKLQQSYYSQTRSRPRSSDKYEVYHKYKKRSLMGHSKEIGLIALSCHKKEIRASYVPLARYPDKAPNTTIARIPLEVSFVPIGNYDPPEIISTSVQLVSLTIKTRSLPIPVVFHPDMLFRNEGRETDNFDHITVKRCQKYAIELSHHMRELGSEALGIDKDMIFDIKSLANLSSKYNVLKVTKTYVTCGDKKFESLASIPYKSVTQETTKMKFTKSFTLNVDMDSVRMIGSGTNSQPGEFCLIPDFQSCYLARLYHFKISIKLSNGEKVSIKVPAIIQKYPSSLDFNSYS
ncbi:hypothetical protein PGUG_04723 [Meyerozyma guilliermondii ATCC 6260]|uniref:Bul1 N-terminal domain-containing protein n=1 Tax=Meyerozyma guilliermondii (strain ATCC 6260 / CBS 566 / DSM 6381 / JCM 1539 / NBRC 10279 / NRRL Y-324) TaxID=294746 RepID=A5DN72_PICGU|nr:uncharacterized protein PGUG_04723 [Meyerozyma guilliermondii ATCC 6260]EDK40625.2 hypothetical protein PGUG_04723 [Meyerozyma guilliermondii ATCC 6260]